MRLIMVAGFLGSGKTTLLLEMAKALTSQTRARVAIIENEVGKVGVDGQYLSGQGLQVREIQSGCVCCQLRGNLLATLYDLEAAFHPDIVLFEPSGVALPDQVADVCRTYGGDIQDIHVVLVVDAIRFENPRVFALPLVTRGIMAADIIVINKMDAAGETQLTDLRKKLREMNARARIEPLSALQGTNMDQFLKDLVTRYADLQRAEHALDFVKQSVTKLDVPEDQGPRAVVHAEEAVLRFAQPVSSSALLDQLSGYMLNFTSALRSEECSLIGHVKAILRSSKDGRNSGFALLSATDFDQKPHVRGALTPQVSEANLTLNAIVYGVDKATLTRLLKGVVTQFNGALATD